MKEAWGYDEVAPVPLLPVPENRQEDKVEWPERSLELSTDANGSPKGLVSRKSILSSDFITYSSENCAPVFRGKDTFVAKSSTWRKRLSLETILTHMF